MSIDPAIWAKLHGASTHFPVALAMTGAALEAAGFWAPERWPQKARLQAAGGYSVMLGALGTFPAVLSGLFLTRGEALGHDELLFHHLFVWPAFALLVGLGTWRALVSEGASRRSFAIYLAGLMAGAGYWGGEMILKS